MTDNGLKVSFDYRKPDAPVLLVYKVFGGSLYFGGDPSVSIVKAYYGQKAIELYSILSGKTIEQIEKEARGENNT